MVAALATLLFTLTDVVTAPELPAASAVERQHHSSQPSKRGIFELKDPAGWPAEPPAPYGLDAAVLRMWQAEHAALDAVNGSTPHRTALAHFFWGDRVWGAAAEDRVLASRRRLLEHYAGADDSGAAAAHEALGISISSPLEG